MDDIISPRSIPACAGEPIYSAYSGGTAWGLSPPVRGNPVPGDR